MKIDKHCKVIINVNGKMCGKCDYLGKYRFHQPAAMHILEKATWENDYCQLFKKDLKITGKPIRCKECLKGD
jgi:hypothetical protein